MLTRILFDNDVNDDKRTICGSGEQSGRTSRRSWPAWSILCRLLSHDDRRRFKAVCRQWRLAAQQRHPLTLPPALPWLSLDHRTYQSVADGRVYRFPDPEAGDMLCRLFRRLSPVRVRQIYHATVSITEYIPGIP